MRLMVVRGLSAAGAFLMTPAGGFICAALLWLVAAVLSIATMVASRENVYSRAIQNAQNLTLVLEHDIERSVDLYDLSLQAAAEGAGDARVMSLPADLRHRVLFDRAANSRYLGPLSVLGSDGRLLVSSAGRGGPWGNPAAMYQFTTGAGETDSSLRISAPYGSTAGGGDVVIVLGRHIVGSDGNSRGMVVGGLSIEYFRNLLEGLALGNDGTAAVVETSGFLVMRLPYDAQMVGRNISASPVFRRLMEDRGGSFVQAGSVDGVRRLYVYRHLSGLPFIVVIAPAISDIFAGWRTRAEWTVLFMILFTVGIGTGVLLFGRELRRRQRAEALLKDMAYHDALTGLENRGTFDKVLSREWLRAQRNARPLSLVFMDIDNFKFYNDYYGHQAGDLALKAVARCVASRLGRPADHAARYGGEEFVIVLPETDSEGAVSVAEDLRRAVFELNIEHAKSTIGRLTISIGVASGGAGTSGISDAETLLKAADAALYDAKSHGRNQVWISKAAADCGGGFSDDGQSDLFAGEV